ncbi:MAG: radical SAM protein [Thermoplasmata archaeon]|nr:radical SAM protein [Thermoplasmata archaeon]TFG70335.1 MAG: radical SAM protein [Methanomassiliicoccus sp.]
MRIVSEYGNDAIAKVYVAQMREDAMKNGSSDKMLVEFVESVQPPLPRDKKWVLIVSSMFGCPVKCKMCDAGGAFAGRLSVDEILAQVDHMVRRRFPDGRVTIPKFKIQFARMGEPSMNPAVLDAMRSLPKIYDAPGLNVSLSTIAPATPGARKFFDNLIEVKDRYYDGGRFQLQFSIHTTDVKKRDILIPTPKWSFGEIAAYGKRFSTAGNGDRKVTLNFAPTEGYPVDASVIREHFNPELFLIKLTPLNPTIQSKEQSLKASIDPFDSRTSERLLKMFRDEGFDVLLSIGELEENRIGSNCGQFIQRALSAPTRPAKSYELERYQASENGN